MVVFVHQFDVQKGNTLVWTNGDPKTLDGLEFTVLPSGIHMRNEDTVHFEVDGKVGLAVFKQNSLDLERSQHHIDRSKVKMFSFGTIFDSSMDYEQLSYYEDGMRAALEAWWVNKDYKVLEQWDARLDRNEETSFNFNKICLSLGPLVLQLWRSALLQERILIFNKGVEVKGCNELCHLLTKIATLENGTYYNAMTITVLNADHLKNMESWCATTSDEILMYDTDLFDKAVVWDISGIHLRDHTREIKCNEVDFTIFKSLTLSDLSSFDYQYESSIIWSKLIIDGLFMIFTGNLYKPWYHLELAPIENPDFHQYLSDKTHHMYLRLKEIVDEYPDQDAIYCNANILIDLKLDYFHDSNFIGQLSDRWFGKAVIPNYIDLSSLF
ncbi:unnamed protein product [Kluyveromyces dobzhanskii CBS 2104]|uniref:WGS project CCBQ000000000 data, contig 00017 n=1 Tax=Kluyveromyces dobzhanskii CBS 2104 TaxID=1427455 RepID=A0A0A8L8F4_9SACH|nr:unnamed protein product [Kluyveromyces dobzhanskii CBS 2104]